jgi:2-dehydropantoate 2-reductase
MSIGIVGGGAIGLLLASVLTETTEVSLYVRRDEQRETLTQNGLIILGQPPVRDFTLKMTSEPWTEDLIIIAVKQPALKTLLIKHNDPVSTNQSLLFIQNGMTHLELLKDLPFKNIFVGSVEHGVRKLKDSVIDWRGKGPIRCGVVKGEAAFLMPLLKQPSLHAEIVLDWFKMLEDKLVANAVINPLTALYEIENGGVFNNPYFLKVAQTLYEEVAVALRMTSEEKQRRWIQIQTICEHTATNRSSMLQDLESGRLTEMDAILGYILNQGENCRQLPVCQFLYDSIKGLEAQGARKLKEH